MTVAGWKAAIRDSALRRFPAAATTLLSVRSRRLSHRLVRRWGLPRLTDRVVRAQGLVVAAGPFQGLRLPEGARLEHLAPYLLGTYECELHPWLEEIREETFRQILDVGAKFGYYAIGLARWFPEAETLAFDTDPWARRQIRIAARANGVASIKVRSFLKPAALASMLRPPVLILSDCEGFEAKLFQRIDPHVLAASFLLVELHEEASPGVEADLTSRFSATHRIEVVRRSERVPAKELVDILGIDDAELAVREFRGDQRWLFGRPRQTVRS